jgi:hypothetical protein
MTPEQKKAYLAQLRKDAEQIEQAFEGEYKEQIAGLYALSKAQVDALVPGKKDLVTYAKLIAIVERASAENLAQAELVSQIRTLGALGVRVARLVPSLAKLVV